MTSGSVFKTVVYFSLPYLLSYFLQTLYGMADLFIVGQFGGVSSTTAVSIGSQIMHMLTVMIVGLAMGSTVMIGRSIGAKNKRQAAECIGNTVTMFMGISMVLMAVLLVLVRPIVGIMSTPAEAVEGTVRYLTICFIGIPFITAYNIISSIFRGMGDSKSPMYFIAMACAANIGLDYLFIGLLGLDAAGPWNDDRTGNQCSCIDGCDFEKKGWNSFGKIGFQTETHDHEKYFKGRSSGVPAGRFHPGIFCCNHDFCKPARTDRCGSSWNCGEDHQYFIPCSIVYDVYNFSTCGAEYRSGKTRPCKADIKICADDYGDIWINYDDYRTVCVSSAGRIIYK